MQTFEFLQECKEILQNLKNRNDYIYKFAGQSQKDYDRGQIDILERIIKNFTIL